VASRTLRRASSRESPCVTRHGSSVPWPAVQVEWVGAFLCRGLCQWGYAAIMRSRSPLALAGPGLPSRDRDLHAPGVDVCRRYGVGAFGRHQGPVRSTPVIALLELCQTGPGVDESRARALKPAARGLSVNGRWEAGPSGAWW
jgi:hypothetical protein